MADERIQHLNTPENCEKFAQNAARLGRPDLALEAKRRAVELRAEKPGAKTQAEKEALQAVYAYEAVQSKLKGRKFTANRTWQMIKRRGVIGAVEAAVNRAHETEGYRALAEMNMKDMAFEAIVLRYPELFSSETVDRAIERMAKWEKEG